VTSAPAKERFVGRTIPLVLAAFALAFAGVLVVDLYIEHRQIEASTHVAASTISTLRTVTDFGRNLHRYHDAAGYEQGDGASTLAELLEAESRLDAAMLDFDEHLEAGDRPTWRELRERLAVFEDQAPLQPRMGPAALEARVHAIQGDLSTLSAIVDRRGLAATRRAAQLHTLEGALEACVLFLLAAALVASLLGRRAQENRARDRDARVEEHLRRTLADLDGFAGRLAHDLRAPLTPILACSQFIEHAPVTDAVRVQAERIERSARRLGRMVEALLQYARASAGGAYGGPPTRVNEAVAEAVADFEDAAASRGGRITTEGGPDATLRCPPEVVESIVGNLVENALKYGVKEGDAPRVTVRTGVEGSSLVVEVEDAGPGIPQELRDRVFEPLFRGQQGGAGIGLGLAIVQRLVETQGGRVQVLQGAEGGALFRVALPLGGASRAGDGVMRGDALSS
jgi:signal transduction histidine kinase